jgi:hypothetical protein
MMDEKGSKCKCLGEPGMFRSGGQSLWGKQEIGGTLSIVLVTSCYPKVLSRMDLTFVFSCNFCNNFYIYKLRQIL